MLLIEGVLLLLIEGLLVEGLLLLLIKGILLLLVEGLLLVLVEVSIPSINDSEILNGVVLIEILSGVVVCVNDTGSLEYV